MKRTASETGFRAILWLDDHVLRKEVTEPFTGRTAYTMVMGHKTLSVDGQQLRFIDAKLITTEDEPPREICEPEYEGEIQGKVNADVLASLLMNGWEVANEQQAHKKYGDLLPQALEKVLQRKHDQNSGAGSARPRSTQAPLPLVPPVDDLFVLSGTAPSHPDEKTRELISCGSSDNK